MVEKSKEIKENLIIWLKVLSEHLYFLIVVESIVLVSDLEGLKLNF